MTPDEQRPAEPEQLRSRLTREEQEAILDSHAAMIWSIAMKLHARNPGIDLDELHAHVRLGFCQAAARFEPSRGLEFSTYAYRSGWREGVLYCRQHHARGFHVPEHHPCWRCPATCEVDADKDRGRDEEDPATVRFPGDFWDHVVKPLPDRERHVILRVYRDGKQYPEVGAELGVTKSRVEQLHKRAMERIRLRRDEFEVYREAA